MEKRKKKHKTKKLVSRLPRLKRILVTGACDFHFLAGGKILTMSFK